ncbi:MAG: hypothetical protein U0401_15770 [Anaerolineae bacterium]
MQKILRLAVLGILIWGLSLIWPEVNEWLTPKVADAVVVGLMVAIGAYILGHQFRTQPRRVAEVKDQPASSPRPHATRPTTPVIYPFSRTPRPTQPIPALVASDLHTRLTRPMPAIVPHAQHSRITRPMPIALTR